MRLVLLNDKGASVVAIVLILSILTALGVIFTSLINTGVEVTTGEALSMRALYAAESGLETAIGRLKQSPVSTNWAWRDGYKDKLIGGGAMDVEVLQYEARDGALTGAFACEPFESTIVATGANPSRTVYAVLSWSSASNMGVELYDNTVADCNNPAASASLIASSLTNEMPETIRHRISNAAPATLTYTVRVLGSAGDSYRLRISHPDESAFGTGNTCAQPAGPPYDECMRALISLGKHKDARREVFAGLSRTP